MRVMHSHILEERKFQDKTIICYIEVANRFVEYYYGQPKHQTHRWMIPEHWALFDAQLEALLNDGALNGEELKERTFYLNESISVKVKNGRKPVDILKQCMKNSTKWNTMLGLEFLIEYRENKSLMEKSEKNVSSENKSADHHEYEPPFMSNSSDNLRVPYTPSVKSYVSPNDKNIFESSSETNYNEQHHEEPYSPKPLSECSPDKNSQSPPIPPYKPMQVTHKEPVTTNMEIDDVQTPQELTEIEEISCNDFKNAQRKVKFKDKNVKSSENIKHDREKHTYKHIAEEKHKIREKDKTKKSARDSEEKCEAECSQTNENENNDDNFSVGKSEKRKRNLYCPQLKPRRSSRSPVKPKRFLDACIGTEEISRNSRSSSKNQTSKNTRNLFGSDDDDDDNQNEDFDDNSHAQKSSKTKKLLLNTSKSTSTESVKNKKDKDKFDYKSETNLMGKWLEKKSTTKLKESKSSSSPSSSVPEAKIKKRKASFSSPISYLSKEEIEEQMVAEKIQMEKNRLLKEALEKVVGPPPVKVETLSIEDLNEEEVLDSFQLYKTKLDKVFRSNSKNAHSIKGHDGINHIFVIRLIDHKIQLKMLNKLLSEYEPNCEGTPAHLTLYANALLPEWILRLFMDRHNLTRDEAIEHIKAQEAYNLHLEAQMENSMSLC